MDFNILRTFKNVRTRLPRFPRQLVLSIPTIVPPRAKAARFPNYVYRDILIGGVREKSLKFWSSSVPQKFLALGVVLLCLRKF